MVSLFSDASSEKEQSHPPGGIKVKKGFLVLSLLLSTYVTKPGSATMRQLVSIEPTALILKKPTKKNLLKGEVPRFFSMEIK